MKKFVIKERILEKNENISRYLDEIEYIELNSLEELELITKIQLGDNIALGKLTKANLKFVVSVAKSYINSGMELNDLINEGNIGIIKAANKYKIKKDGSKNVKFITYAVWWIRQSIITALNNNSKKIRTPMNHNLISIKIKSAREELYKTYGYAPSANEIAMHINEAEYTVEQNMMNEINVVISTDSKLSDDDNNTGTYGDLLTYNNDSFSPDYVLNNESRNKSIEMALNMLPMKHKVVIDKLFGFNAHPDSIDTVAAEMNLTPERIRQIKKDALTMLRLNKNLI